MALNETNILKIENLFVYYGRVQAIKQVSLEVGKGEIIALIGANGSGKSTLMAAVLGIRRAASGTILFKGHDITWKPTHDIVASHITLVPEGHRVLSAMTVMENLQLGAYQLKGNIDKYLSQVFDRFPVLRERRNQLAGTLSGGEQQMLSIGRALMGAPELLMMDEPSLGLAPLVVEELFRVIVDLKGEGYTILLAEQNAQKALQHADRGYVFETGSVVLEGAAQELASNPEVRRAYLGGAD